MVCNFESALRGASELSNEGSSVNKLGKYAKVKQTVEKSTENKQSKQCYRCGNIINKSITEHIVNKR